MLAELWTILTLQGGFNTTVVLLGSACLGAAAAVVGVFVLLRKRALISDAISHATLPGVALGFLVAYGLGLDGGRNLPILLTGAALTGVLGVLAVQWIKDHTRLPEDTAIGSVLSVFFGAGMVLISTIQTLSGGSRAGLNSFLLGQTAALSSFEAELIAGAALVVITLALLFCKEMAAVCFDAGYVQSLGWRVWRIDLLMMALMLTVLCIGLKTVGLVLIIALLIIPPVAARFWTDRLGRMLWIAGLFGAASCYVGAALSALLPRLPAGGVIVLTAGGLFVLSLLIAPARGVIAALVRHWRFRLALSRRQVLAAVHRGHRVRPGFARARLALSGLVDARGRPTERGRSEAARAARDQSLWDRFLQDFPQEAFARSHFFHRPLATVVPADLLAELESRLAGAR